MQLIRGPKMKFGGNRGTEEYLSLPKNDGQERVQIQKRLYAFDENKKKETCSHFMVDFPLRCFEELQKRHIKPKNI